MFEMSQCKFLIHGATTDTCHNYAPRGICRYHSDHARHIIKNANYETYYQSGICAGIVSSTDYPLCTNQSMNGSWFCKTHCHQSKRNNLEFVNFVRENQGHPIFMDWVPTKNIVSQKVSFNLFGGI